MEKNKQTKKDDTSERDFLKKCEVCAMRFGRKERPDGEKARQQKSKVHERLLHTLVEVDMVTVVHIQHQDKVIAFICFSKDSVLSKEVRQRLYFRGGNRLSRLSGMP